MLTRSLAIRTVRRALLAVLVLCAVGTTAAASVSIAVSWTNLLRQSNLALIGTPLGSTAAWDAGRIYTTTRLRVDRVVAGSAPGGSEIAVRTMGGIVGEIGQRVDGEPVLVAGQPSLLFLHAGPGGSFEVTARAQGQYLVVSDPSKTTSVLRSAPAGALMPPPGSPRLAHEALHEQPTEQAILTIASAWSSSHAP